MSSVLTFPPNDLLIGPIVTQLSSIITNQVGGVTNVYQTPPAGPPDDSSVILVMSRGDQHPRETIGRIRTRNTFVLMHFFRFNDTANAYLNAYSYLYSYINAFEDWQNQNLNGKSNEVNVKSWGINQHPYAGQPYLVLGMTIEVVAEMPTPTT